MIRAYNDIYIEDAMSALGGMLDYAVNTCGEELNLFYQRFLASGVAHSLYRGNPKYIAGMSGIELAMLVALRTGDELTSDDYLIDIGSPEYWTGWTMAYLSWYLCMDYDILQARGVTIDALYIRYAPLHEADISKAVQFAERRLLEYAAANNPLKEARKNAGLTQGELAKLSDNTIHAIRAWEQGRCSIKNARAESVLNLCRVLGCRAESIML